MKRVIGFGCLVAAAVLVAVVYRLDGAPGEWENNLGRLVMVVVCLLAALVCLVAGRGERTGGAEIHRDLPGGAQWHEGRAADAPSGSGIIGRSNWQEMDRLSQARRGNGAREPKGWQSLGRSQGREGNGAGAMRNGQSVVNPHDGPAESWGVEWGTDEHGDPKPPPGWNL